MWKIILSSWLVLLVPGIAQAEPAECEVSATVRATSPVEPNSDAVGPTEWYRNSDQTIWVALTRLGWTNGGNKTYWVRPAGTDLQISGHLQGYENTVLQTDIPCCYPTGFQIVGLIFPVAGCWNVEAVSGDATLRFTTLVGQRED